MNAKDTRNIYTVRQINSYVKRMFEDDFVLRAIYVKGEISNCKYHHSGHIYFSLKDESGVIAAVMFASDAAGLKMRLEDGMQVVVHGRVSVYERDGRYQLYAKTIEEAGEGELYRRFEELKARLEEMGMFSEIYKKPVPRYAMKIGVVTARTGAVIRDIYNVAKRRNPYCSLLLYPAQVQGEGAAETIVSGIRALDRQGLDCIIIGRGGGSMEDLWCFNDERVAKAIFECETPLISAVGHETDFTIADFVADLRAPTPSAAAELAVFDYYQFQQDLDRYADTLGMIMSNRIRAAKDQNEMRKLRLLQLSPRSRLIRDSSHLTMARTQLDDLMKTALRSRRERLKVSAERLAGLSPLRRLSEGYAFVADESGRAVQGIEGIKPGQRLEITVSDGQIDAEVSGTRRIRYE